MGKPMMVSLNGRVYRVVHDSDGERVVIVKTGPSMWHVTDHRTAEKVANGFLLAPLRMAI